MLSDLWIEVIVIAMLAVVIAQNMSLRERIKALESKLDRRP
jgi:Tfp pilus assembly protein PilX